MPASDEPKLTVAVTGDENAGLSVPGCAFSAVLGDQLRQLGLHQFHLVSPGRVRKVRKVRIFYSPARAREG